MNDASQEASRKKPAKELCVANEQVNVRSIKKPSDGLPSSRQPSVSSSSHIPPNSNSNIVPSIPGPAAIPSNQRSPLLRNPLTNERVGSGHTHIPPNSNSNIVPSIPGPAAIPSNQRSPLLDNPSTNERVGSGHTASGYSMSSHNANLNYYGPGQHPSEYSHISRGYPPVHGGYRPMHPYHPTRPDGYHPAVHPGYYASDQNRYGAYPSHRYPAVANPTSSDGRNGPPQIHRHSPHDPRPPPNQASTSTVVSQAHHSVPQRQNNPKSNRPLSESNNPNEQG
jgi:hypothetical protein